MAETLAAAACRLSLANGFAEIRRYVDAKSIFINDIPAEKWDQKVYQGDVIRIGKRRTGVV